EFEVSIFTKVSNFLQQTCSFDLVIVDYSIPAANYEKEIDGCQLIRHIKASSPNPPLVILATGFLSKNELGIGHELCPEADGYLAKDAGLDATSLQIKQLLATRLERHPARTSLSTFPPSS
ncbi:MAG TPA: hypothetical protein DEV81_16155, partial [Cyanobacteria bacterium UBA11049]|nr:hypothetical protein [Cyanobacteria bacterium UBA11049]